MLVAVALALLLPMGPALVAIPDEPGARVLLEGDVYQAVAADLDGDGARDIVILRRDGARSIVAEGWRQAGESWSALGEPVEVVPPDEGVVTWTGTPARLLVRSIGGADRVTLVRQPIDRRSDLDPSCCLRLDDVVPHGGGMRLAQVAEPSAAVDAVHVLDLDGDGTDEVVTSRSIPPLGDISYPTAISVLRWGGERFSAHEGELPVGSGDTPFFLGDSDGRPGDELGIIATLGRAALYRVSQPPPGSDDILAVEDAGLVAEDAVAVPVGAGRGIAILARGTIAVQAWPSAEPLEPPISEVPMGEAVFLGTVALDGTESVIARQTVGGDRIHAFGLPDLAPPRFGAITRSPAAAAFASGPTLPYVGLLPGGGPDGQPAIVYGGRLLSSAAPPQAEPFSGVRFATMAGSQPIGIVGADAGQLALLHGALGPAIDPRGGRLDPPTLNMASAISVAPFELALSPELDDARLEPRVVGAISIGPRRAIAIGPGGFTATVAAPPGSRVYVGSEDPSVVETIAAVPESGTVGVPMLPTAVPTPNARYRASLGVTTPAGHSYLATWEVRVLDTPPPLEVSVNTPVGSGEVEIRGRSAPYASVSVDGQSVPTDLDGAFAVQRSLPPWPTAISVVATDPFGNVAERSLTGVGWFDYRGLPWIPIVAIGVAVAGSVLYVRVPRTRPMPRRADDDAGFEELEPD
jgi:hypothetical protein